MGNSINSRDGANVLAFTRRPSHPLGLTVSDRIQAIRWADAARVLGVREVRIHDPEPGDDASVGGFLLIYEKDNIWAAWGVAVRAASFELWRPGSGATVGWYKTLREALQMVRRVV